jgi:hypothetical protein
MPDVKEMQAALAKVTKTLSLNQVAIRSKINYVTLRNIKLGKSKRVTAGVSKRLVKFIAGYSPELLVKAGATAAPKAPGKVAPKAPSAKGRKKAVPAAKPRKTGKRGRPRRLPAAAPSLPATSAPAMFLGDALNDEISLVKARLDYLLSLQKAEAAYIKAIKK